MGQPLVFSIKEGEKEILNVYYYWSGYTLEAMEIVSNFMKNYKKHKVNLNLKEEASVDSKTNLALSLHTLQEMNSFLSEESQEDMKKLKDNGVFDNAILPKGFEISENVGGADFGIIESTLELMDENESRGEMYISCDLINETIFFPEFGDESDFLSELEECYYDLERLSLKDVSSYISCDGDEVSLCDLEKLITVFKENDFELLEVNEGVFILNVG